jgi:NAD dependent epimerase/dehydratase family enzyme
VTTDHFDQKNELICQPGILSQQMKVLIPGGAGYIGSVLVGHLLNRGHQVTVLDNLFFQQKSLFGYAPNPNFEFVYGDTRDKATVEPLVAKADVIIHLAAVVGILSIAELWLGQTHRRSRFERSTDYLSLHQ